MSEAKHTPTVLAHAIKVRRVTILALRRAMALTGFCEMCGAATYNVAFLPRGIVAESCAACLADAGLSVGDEAGR